MLDWKNLTNQFAVIRLAQRDKLSIEMLSDAYTKNSYEHVCANDAESNNWSQFWGNYKKIKNGKTLYQNLLRFL